MRGVAGPAALAALALVSAALYPMAAPLADRLGWSRLAGHQIVFGLLFVLYLAALWLVTRILPPTRAVLAVVLGAGLLFRVAVLPTPVYLSSDVFRYLWDGRVQVAGINPYRYPPEAPELEPLRPGTLHPHINRPWARTIYPPAAQWLFVASAWLVPMSVLGWRLILLAFEIATTVLLLRLLRGLGVAPPTVLAYLWSPLVVFEGVQGGHLEVVTVTLVLAALALRGRGSSLGAGVALGLAVLVKLSPLLLVAAWHRRRDWRFPATVLVVVALAYAPYAATLGTGALGFLPEYLGSAEDFNIGLRALLTWLLGLAGEGPRAAVMALLFALLGAAVVAIGWRRGPGPAGLWQAAGLTAAAHLLLVPTSLHPWYLVWLVPFLCGTDALHPWARAAWLWFTGAVTLSYVKYLAWEAPLPWWAWALEYVPLYALLLVAVWLRRPSRAPAAIAVSGLTPRR